MKIKEAIKMLNEDERIAVRAALSAQCLGNGPGLLAWYDACLALEATDVDWGEQALRDKMGFADSKHEPRNYFAVRTSALVKCIERYWKQIAFEKDEILQELCLLRELRQRKRGRAYMHIYQHAFSALEATQRWEIGHFAAKLELEEEKQLYGLEAGTMDYSKPLYHDAFDSLEKAYVLKRLNLACKALSQDRDFGTVHDLPEMDGLLMRVEAWQGQDTTLIQLYAMLFRLIRDQETDMEGIFHGAKGFLERYLQAAQQDMPDENQGKRRRGRPKTIVTERAPASLVDLQDAFTYLINYCVLRMNLGDATYGGELVQLYEKLLSERILEVQGKLSVGNFRNAFLLLSRTGNRLAVRDLLTHYGDRVEGEAAEATVLFLKGIFDLENDAIAAAQLHFLKSLGMLPVRTDERQEAELRAMLALMAYRLGDEIETDVHVHALRRLLAKKRRLGVHASPFIQFEQYFAALRKLAKPPEKPNRPESAALAAQLRAEPAKVFAKKWLLATLDLLSTK